RSERSGLRVLEQERKGRFSDPQVHRGVAERETGQVDGEELARAADDRLLLDEAVVADGVADGAAHSERVPALLDGDTGPLAWQQRGDDALARRAGPGEQSGDEVVVGRIAERAEVLQATYLVAAGHRVEDCLERQLVAEARFRLAGDGGDELALLNHLSEVALLRLSVPRASTKVSTVQCILKVRAVA